MTRSAETRGAQGDLAPAPREGGARRSSGGEMRVSGLTKEFTTANAPQGAVGIHGISFDIPEGSFFTLVGPSGCGKTTTLRCIAGLEQADSGDITIGGEVVFSAQGKRNLRPEERPIALVPQAYGIWPHMTVYDNAAFPLKHGRHRGNRRDAKRRVMEMLERVGLEDVAPRWATQLSGGQQQRLALARALLCDPQLLLLDEPLSNLDAKLRSQLRTELKSFQRDFGITTLYVTHDQSEALALSDGVAVLRKGRVEQMGSPKDLYDSPASAFVADFIGNANLVEGTADMTSMSPEGVTVVTVFGTVICHRVSQYFTDTSAFPAGCTVCLRPEHVEVEPAGQTRPAVNVYDGRVISAEFLGDRQELVVELNGEHLRGFAPAFVDFALGDTVAVHIDPARALLLPK